MPDPVDKKTTAADTPAETEGFGSETLEEMLAPASDFGEPGTPVEKPKESSESPLTVAEVQRLIAENDSKWQEKFEETQQENGYYKGRIAELSEQVNRPAPAEVGPQPFTYNEAEFATELEANAPKAIAKYIQAFLAHQTDNIKRDVSKDVDGKLSSSAAQQQRIQQYNRDVASLNEDFTEQLKDKAFIADSDKELEALIKSRGGASIKDYLPGDLHSAASRVALRWAKAGKLSLGKPTEQTQPATNNFSLKEIVRRVPASDSVGNGTGTQRTGPPTTIDQLWTSQKDRDIARRVIKKQGIDEAAYVRSYLRNKEADPDYDR